jgi:hypothetical protein
MICSNCGEDKESNKFYYRKNGNLLSSKCKNCFLLKTKEYYSKNSTNILIKRQEYYKENKEGRKKYLNNNKDNISKRREKYYKENKEHYLEYAKKHNKERYNNDINFKMKCILRSRILKALKNNQKIGHAIQLLGCSIDEFRVYLEKEFDQNMTWENCGSYWHIDHIKPCSLFDLSDPEQQKICFHYTNMQPMEAIENIRKGNKFDVENSETKK